MTFERNKETTVGFESTQTKSNNRSLQDGSYNFIISVFCICDDWLKDKPLRQRGPAPILCDSEVLTMEIVGEFLGCDEDQALFDFFHR